MDKLLNCPFCGSDDVRAISFSSNEFVKCEKCGASSDDSNGIKKWNQRPLTKTVEIYMPVGDVISIQAPCGDEISVKTENGQRTYWHKGVMVWNPSNFHRVGLMTIMLHEDSLRHKEKQLKNNNG